jgi:TetR/AcrR family transcriptional regulator, transcriptional repressor for nem operon
VLAGGAIERHAALPPAFAALAQGALLSEAALSLRVELALRAITVVPSQEQT